MSGGQDPARIPHPTPEPPEKPDRVDKSNSHDQHKHPSRRPQNHPALMWWVIPENHI